MTKDQELEIRRQALALAVEGRKVLVQISSGHVYSFAADCIEDAHKFARYIELGFE